MTTHDTATPVAGLLEEGSTYLVVGSVLVERMPGESAGRVLRKVEPDVAEETLMESLSAVASFVELANKRAGLLVASKAAITFTLVDLVANLPNAVDRAVKDNGRGDYVLESDATFHELVNVRLDHGLLIGGKLLKLQEVGTITRGISSTCRRANSLPVELVQ